jgi:CTP-dependent riboflavin kinase
VETVIDEFCDEELLDYIKSIAPKMEIRQPGQGIIVREYASRMEYSYRQAAKILHDMVNKGLLVSRKMLWNGRIVNVYFKPDNIQ